MHPSSKTLFSRSMFIVLTCVVTIGTSCQEDDNTQVDTPDAPIINFDTSNESDLGESDSNDGQIDPPDLTTPSDDPVAYNPDWTEASHEKTNPNYEIAFPDEKVNKIEITITADQWTTIRENMVELWGSDFGEQTGAGGDFVDENPTYVDAHFSFNGKSWKNVGFRLKGNSTLSGSWGSGIYKLPFKLDFDEFEDSIPAIDNQRFYGFKKISFSPAYKDSSLIRDRLANSIFRMAGVPAAQSAFYEVWIDFGSGLKYCGVYTGLEVIDDKMVETEFSEDDGNLYKPESYFSSFNASEFEKKNNEDEADFSDVQAFVTALNSSNRTSNPAQWRADIEEVFNMDHFLKYLAVNNTIVNWDSYGVMAHNFYLYNHSADKLTWIPWDHNEALSGSPGISSGGGGRGRTGVSLSMVEISTQWPLLNYVANDPVYLAQYKAHLKAFNDGVFSQAAMDALIDKYTTLISPFVVGENGENTGYTHLRNTAEFTQSKAELKAHIAARKNLVSTYTD